MHGPYDEQYESIDRYPYKQETDKMTISMDLEVLCK